MKITIEEFNELPKGTVFAIGELSNSPAGIYMTNNDVGKMLRWVAKKGLGNDWSVYCHWADKNEDWIEKHGDKVTFMDNVRKCVQCDDDVLKLYRL